MDDPLGLIALNQGLTQFCGTDEICRQTELQRIQALAALNDIQATMTAMNLTAAAVDACGQANPACSVPLRAQLALNAEASRQAALQQNMASLPGGSPVSSPFDLGFSLNSLQPSFTGAPPGPSQPESFFGSLVGAIPSLLTSLANAGVIRGSVGQALAPMNASAMSAVGMQPASFVASAALPVLLGGGGGALQTLGNLSSMGNLASNAMNLLGGLFGNGGNACGAGPQPVVMAPTLFRTNACGKSTLPSRVQVMGPNGAIYVVANLGRATRGASEGRVMRRLARDNGFTVARRGSGARGRRRRSPR